MHLPLCLGCTNLHLEFTTHWTVDHLAFFVKQERRNCQSVNLKNMLDAFSQKERVQELRLNKNNLGPSLTCLLNMERILVSDQSDIIWMTFASILTQCVSISQSTHQKNLLFYCKFMCKFMSYHNFVLTSQIYIVYC